MHACNIFLKIWDFLSITRTVETSNFECRLAMTGTNEKYAKLENVAIANALELEAARATPVLCRFCYNAMPSLISPNLSIAVL